MSSHLKAELAATCSTLGHLHKGNYLIEPECFQSVKDLIHYLKRDNDAHEIRRYLGESKVLQNDLIHIIKSCPKEDSDLFGATLRLLINLTTPTLLFYGEDIPAEKIERNIYLSLIGYSQDYKIAFCDVEFWNKICGKLTDLFEIDWADRSADEGIQIERILMLLRNVLQVPADLESENRPENDVTIHDKILWTLRQSQILELLLFISSDQNEEQYYLNLLEIFSLILREQNPKLLATCDTQRSAEEKNRDTEELIKVRESEKRSRIKYLNMRNFNATFVMKGVKSLSNRDIVCHKALDKVRELDLNNIEKKQIRARRGRVPVESDRLERRSTCFVRLFLKEFCLEFLNSSFKHLMNVVKNKLDSGKTLANDQTYYFWALKFFLDFATAANADVELIQDFLSSETFHFVQTNIDNAFEHLISDKNKNVNWVKRIHLILKAYRSLLETLLWMDCSTSVVVRSTSREIKSKIFYVVEYREMTLHLLLRYDPTKFSISYLRDLMETTHLFIKLLEDYSKQAKLVVQKIARKKKLKKKSKEAEVDVETREEKWEKIKDDVYDMLCSETAFPEMPPFDAALEIPIDDQKGRAMKTIQEFLHEGRIKDGIGLLRSARLVWPENDYFGFQGMSVEDETMALQEICLANLEQVEGGIVKKTVQQPVEGEEGENEDFEDECSTRIVEQDFDIMEYKKRLVNKRIVEGCGLLLRNYKNNSAHTNHCVIKLLHRIGWECCMPAMLFQASIFWTLLKIMKDDSGNYSEIQTFTVNLLRKFRKLATRNPVIFLELLFWKEHNVALEIQHGYEPYSATQKERKKKSKGKLNSDGKEKKKRRKKNNAEFLESGVTENEDEENSTSTVTKRKRKQTGKGVGRARKLSPVILDDRVEEKETLASDEHCDGNSMSTESNKKSVSLQRKYEGVKEIQEYPRESIETGKSHSEKTDVDDGESPSDEEDGGGSDSTLSRGAFERGNHKTLKEIETESKGRENYKRASKKSRFICSSDSEDETIREAGEVSKTGLENSDQEEEKDDENGHGSNAQNSAFRRQRSRELTKGETQTGGFPEDADGSNNSVPKRPRVFCSDSDTENFESGEAEPIFLSGGIRKRKRITVIESDSDVDINSSDEKGC